MITLDADNIACGDTEVWIRRMESLGISYAVYSTRSHRPAAPRLRFVVPLSRLVSADEYCFLAREMAYHIDNTMRIFDPTTFQPERLMYWPSVDTDIPFIYKSADAPLLSPDNWLADQWQDISRWRQVPGHEADTAILHALHHMKQQPEEAAGIVGLFNRTYSIHDAMTQFLAGTYEETPGVQDRYTYTGGSATGGAVVYDSKFLYSHHATDPAGGVLCNAFDLVRLHRYPDMDNDIHPRANITKRPSYIEMKKFAKSLPDIKAAMAKEKAADMDNAFAGLYNTPGAGVSSAPAGHPGDGVSGTPQANNLPAAGSAPGMAAGQPLQVSSPGALQPFLDADDRGDYKPTVRNYKLILMHDPALRGCMWRDIFAGVDRCERMPGRADPAPRPFGMRTDAGPLVAHIQSVYDMPVNMRFLEMAIHEVFYESERHPVREWMDVLVWDGVERLDRLLVRTLGAVDTEYTRAVTRKTVCAVVKRAYDPGAKFDAMLVLDGGQGTGKSTLTKILAIKPDWHIDSVPKFSGKDAYEIITGRLVIEVAEMAAFSKTDVRQMKNFITQTSYKYRPAYGDKILDFPTQCILIGTTNDREFLNDSTGGRRYWVVPTAESGFRREAFDDARQDIAQIYAEAKHRLFVEHESLELPSHLQDELRALQEDEYTAHSTWYYEILEYLHMPVPENWHDMTLQAKGVYLANTAEFEQETQRQQMLGQSYRMRYTTNREVFELVIRQRIGGEHAAFDKRIQMEISAALTECKCKKHTVWAQGKAQKVWFVTDSKGSNPN